MLLSAVVVMMAVAGAAVAAVRVPVVDGSDDAPPFVGVIQLDIADGVRQLELPQHSCNISGAKFTDVPPPLTLTATNVTFLAASTVKPPFNISHVDFKLQCAYGEAPTDSSVPYARFGVEAQCAGGKDEAWTCLSTGSTVGATKLRYSDDSKNCRLATGDERYCQRFRFWLD
mmetsp:Transcript_15500/g.38360  ORF Transcript_15500/g.38360 Transcript_15500/m.38360 type:complete len:172 (+) Transcript_15500:102-617(+)